MIRIAIGFVLSFVIGAACRTHDSISRFENDLLFLPLTAVGGERLQEARSVTGGLHFPREDVLVFQICMVNSFVHVAIRTQCAALQGYSAKYAA